MKQSKSDNFELWASKSEGYNTMSRNVSAESGFHESLPTNARNLWMMDGRGVKRFSASLGALDAGACDREGHLRTSTFNHRTATRRHSAVGGVAELGRSLSESAQNGISRFQIFTLVTLCLVNFCNAICYSLLAPFFPEEAKQRGVPSWLVGLIFGIFELVIFITSPFFGTYITQIGARFTFIAGIFVAGVCAVLFGFLDQLPPGPVYIAMCFVVRIVQALGCSAFMTASFAIVANTFPSKIATMFGTLETFNGLGMMTGPVIGGALYEVGGFYLPFFVTGGILILAATWSIFILPAQNDTPKAKTSGSVLSLLRIPAIAIVALAIMLNSCTLGFMEPTLAEHLKQFHLSATMVGVMFLVPSGLYAATAPLWGWIGDKLGRTKSVMVFGNIGLGVAFLLLGPCPIVMEKSQLWMIIVSLVILGISIGAAMVPTLQESLECALAHGYEDNFETYGFVSGIFASFLSLGAFIGPIGGGALVGACGFPWASAIVGGIMFILAILMVVFYLSQALCCRTPSITRDVYNTQVTDVTRVTDVCNARTPLLVNSNIVT